MTDYKHRIAAVYVFRNRMVVVFDQYGQQMPFFQGRQSKVMAKIKNRIDRQKPCGVFWKIQEGAKFYGESGVILY